jgi:tRNA G18 (ribose-2'-O)-methylase SpoU
MYQDENSHEEQIEQDNNIYKLALAAGVNVSKVGGEWERLLDKMSDQRPHNGYVLEASPVPKLPVTALEKVERPSETFDVEVGHQSAEELAINSTFDLHGSLGTLPSVGGTQRYPFLLMLDRIRDPGNLGSIIRSAYFLGAEAIALIEHGTAPIGPIALKSSASAAEHLPLLIVKNEHAFMRKSQENGWKFFAATAPDSPSAGFAGPKPLQLDDVTTALQDGPFVLVLGSEEGGIRPQLQRIVNGTVGIASGRGSVQGLDSLNVGVAAAMLMQSFLHGSKRAASLSEGPSEKDSPKPASEKMFEF